MIDNKIYINKDSNKQIKVGINTPITYIFGGNGTGKTTFSRIFDMKTCAVFNEDFINKNVYITGTDGAKMDSGNKENFSDIFLGEEAVKLAQYVQARKQEIKEYNQIIVSDLSEINKILQFNKLPAINDLFEIISKIDIKFNFDSQISYKENISNFNIIKFLKTTIASDDEFFKAINIYKEETLTKDLIAKINESVILKDIVDQQKLEITSTLIDNYMIILNDITENERLFSKGTDIEETKNWVKMGLKLHQNLDTCIFCDNQNIENKKQRWYEALQNKKQQVKNDLLVCVKEKINAISIITKNKDLYIKIAPELCKSLSEAESKLNELLSVISKSLSVKHFSITINIDDIFKEIVDLAEELKNYAINKVLKERTYTYFYVVEFEKLIKISQKESNKKNLEYATCANSKICEYCSILGFDKELQVVTDNRGSQPKINLSADKITNKFSYYSDGQKHKIALAVFLAMVDLHVGEYDYIILDDPVISLDVHAYHAFKYIIMDCLPKKKPQSKIIILTHNINFLYIMISNLFDNPRLASICNVLEITPVGVKKIPLELLNFDDISLFKHTLLSIDDINDLSLKYWIFMKVFRSFLDLRLRMDGIPTTFNPQVEIQSLNISDEEKKKLQNISNYLCGICRNCIVKVKAIKEMYVDLNEALHILGFPDLISEDNTRQLEKFSDDKLTLESPKGNNFLQEVLLYARNVHFYSGDGINAQIQNYVNHPRHQITESLIAIKEKVDYS